MPNAPPRSLLSLQGQSLLQDFRRETKDPVYVLKDRLREGTLDTETVRICLGTYKATPLVSLSTSQRIARLKADSMGAIALDFLWKDDQRFQNLIRNDPLVFQSLCFCLAAEGKDNYIISLLRLEKPTGGPLPVQWRGSVLRCVIKAKLATMKQRGRCTRHLLHDPRYVTLPVLRNRLGSCHRPRDMCAVTLHEQVDLSSDNL